MTLVGYDTWKLREPDYDDNDPPYDDREPPYDDDDRDRCVLGDACCCPHPFHGADECFDAEMAQSFMRAEVSRSELTGRERTRARWRKRGRR